MTDTQHGDDTVSVIPGKFNPELTRLYQRDDVGNSDRFLFAYGEIVRYNADTKRWHIWDSQTWRPASDAEIRRLAKEVSRHIYHEAASFEKDTEREAHWKFAKQSNRKLSIDGFLTLSQGDVIIHNNDFNKFSHKINMKNGVLDLRDFSFHYGGIKEEYHSLNTGIPYDPFAMCPKWNDHINMVFNNDQKLIEAFQQSMGYCLLGSNSEYLFIFYGLGKNGKSVTLMTLLRIFGDYGISIDPDTLQELRKQASSAPKEDLFRLAGKRFGFSSEPMKQIPLNTALIKALTGGEKITARTVYGRETIEQDPSIKICLATNNQPRLRETTYALKSRLRMFPFEITIPPEVRRNQMVIVKELIETESTGIFNWLVEGLKKYRINGDKISECEKVQSATLNMFLVNDRLGRCISESAIVQEGAVIEKGLWYDHVNGWCRENEEAEFTMKALTEAMREKGLHDKRDGRTRYWIGIRIKKADENDIIQLPQVRC